MRGPRIYASFDAAGSKNPAASDLKYYFLLRAWSRRRPLSDGFVDVHRAWPRFDPGAVDLRGELAKRLRDSDALLLILSERTPSNGGWVSWEIQFAARECRLPLVCAYPGCDDADARAGRRHCWPDALRSVASAGAARVVHVPFRPQPLARAFSELTCGDR